MLFTALSTLLAIVCGLCAWIALRASERAEAASLDIRQSKGLIVANTASCDSLLTQLQKLRGSFFAFKAAIEDGAYPPPPAYPLTDARFAPAPLCENYAKAQADGPMSPAARCDCGYCAEMRARRDAARDALIPKTAAGQAAMARENARGG